MKLELLIFLLSLLLVILASWSLGAFIRLNRAKDSYTTNTMLEAACQVSRPYISIGLWSGLTILLLSLVLLAWFSWNLYHNF